eukprot:5409858-Pyramimonas_sp.AAC.1
MAPFPRVGEKQHHNPRYGRHVLHLAAAQTHLWDSGRTIIVAAGILLDIIDDLKRVQGVVDDKFFMWVRNGDIMM